MDIAELWTTLPLIGQTKKKFTPFCRHSLKADSCLLGREIYIMNFEDSLPCSHKHDIALRQLNTVYTRSVRLKATSTFLNYVYINYKRLHRLLK